MRHAVFIFCAWCRQASAALCRVVNSILCSVAVTVMRQGCTILELPCLLHSSSSFVGNSSRHCTKRSPWQVHLMLQLAACRGLLQRLCLHARLIT